AYEENDDYDNNKSLGYQEASPSEHATQHENLEKEVEPRSRVHHSRAQSSTDNSAKAREKGSRHQRLPASATDSSRASRQDGSLLQDVYNGLDRLPEVLYPLLHILYSLLKWPLFLYILRISASHALNACTKQMRQFVEPYCEKWIIESMIPFCSNSAGTPKGTAADFKKGVLLQEELGGVMESVGHNHELARAMSRHEWVLRDLRIRVTASKFSLKTELVREMNSLIKLTEDAAWAVSSFTAKTSKATNIIIAIDEDAVKKLEAIDIAAAGYI
ncbi:hypothetical protein MMC18_007258, partial [Xylographa bjoerkii]|nr:hypothetical protein [Xylographa bjoerkii]